MVFMPNRSISDYLFEKAEQCFRRSRTDSSVRVELEALGNVAMLRWQRFSIREIEATDLQNGEGVEWRETSRRMGQK
jgi:hypothetical protein